MKLLISNGADINILDHCGASATIWAIQCREVGTTKMLIESNAELNLKSQKGNTAFSMALWKGEKDIMNIIIKQVNKNWIRKGPNQFKNIHTQEWYSYNATGVPYIFVKTIHIPVKKKYRNRTNLNDSFNDCSSINEIITKISMIDDDKFVSLPINFLKVTKQNEHLHKKYNCRHEASVQRKQYKQFKKPDKRLKSFSNHYSCR